VPADSAVVDPLGGESVTGAGLAKAEALGRFVGRMALPMESKEYLGPGESTGVALFTSDLMIPVENEDYKRLIRSGRMVRSMTTDSLSTTEMNMLLIGEAWVMTMPGEVFPEQINGGIAAQPGADFEGNPEGPTIRPLLRGKLNIVTGNGSDAIGPLVPYIQWDSESTNSDSRSDLEGEGRAVSPVAPNLLQRGFIGLMRSTMAYMSTKIESANAGKPNTQK
jgi:hypothetical protein